MPILREFCARIFDDSNSGFPKCCSYSLARLATEHLTILFYSMTQTISLHHGIIGNR